MNQNITLQFGQFKTITLSPKKADGSPATLVAPPTWIRIFGSSASIAPSSDGLSAVITASADFGGRSIFAVYADAGQEIIGFVLGVQVVPSEAVALDPTIS